MGHLLQIVSIRVLRPWRPRLMVLGLEGDPVSSFRNPGRLQRESVELVSQCIQDLSIRQGLVATKAFPVFCLEDRLTAVPVLASLLPSLSLCAILHPHSSALLVVS